MSDDAIEIPTRKVGTQVPVTQEFWEQRDEHVERVMEDSARRKIAAFGTIVTDLERKVAYEGPFDRQLFPEIYESDPPPMVIVRYTARVITD